MPLTKENLAAIHNLLFSIENQISQLDKKMSERFNIVDENFDALFKRDETRGEEYRILTHQMSRLEGRVVKLEDKI